MTKMFHVGHHDVPETPWISPRVAIDASADRGRGLFAKEPIAIGETVLVWGGDSYTDEAGADLARSQGRGVMQWDDGLYSCEGGTDHEAFAINHSCNPNIWMQDVFTLTARRDIPRGTELCLDYATLGGQSDKPADWACRCGEPDCRGRITGADWKKAELRIRYAGHFTPWLAQMIAKDSA